MQTSSAGRAMRALQPKRVAVAGVALIGGLAAPLVLAPSAGAATITVTSTADDGSAGTLRDAFDQANTNTGPNTIVLAAGATYELTDCAFGVLSSTAGPLTITGNGATVKQTCPGEGVVTQGDATGVTMTNVTITGGSTLQGAGIFSQGPVSLTGTTITGNAASLAGGGIYSNSGAVTLVDSHVDANNGVVSGAIFANGPASITGSTVHGNTSLAGGAITVGDTSDTTITNSQVAGNTGNGVFSSGRVVLQGTSVDNNSGAGVTSGTASVELTQSTVADNGGGISAGTNVTLTDSSVTGNTSAGSVGGVSAGANVTATNSTVTSNVGTTVGGISSLGATNLQYVTVAANAGGTASQLSVTDGLTAVATVVGTGNGGPSCVSPTTASTGYNYEQTSNTCGFGAGTGDVASGADPLLLALAANGGPTKTHLFNTNSALHDAVPAASPLCTGTTTDQRGYSRPQGTGCDIGAVEMRLPVASNGSATTTVGVPVNTDLHPLVADPDGWLAGATYSVNPPASNGATVPTGDGQVLYTPNGGFAGSDAYGYVVTDSRKVSSVSATINVTVTGTPPAPANPATPLNVTPAYTG